MPGKGKVAILGRVCTIIIGYLERIPNGSGRKTVEFCHSGASRNLVKRLILLDSGLRRNDGSESRPI